MSIIKFIVPLALAGVFQTGFAAGLIVESQQPSPVQAAPASKLRFAQPVTCEFSVKASDETLQSSLNRWAKAAGWQSVAWNYPEVFVDYNASFCGEGGFQGAVERLMEAQNRAGVPLFARIYSNNVVEIVGAQ